MRLLQTTNYKLPTNRKAFTLIEILIVCTIIALLAAVVIVNLEKAQAKSRDVQRKGDLSLIAAAIEMYKVDTKGYPNYPDPAGVNADRTGMPVITTAYLLVFPNDPLNSSVPSRVYKYRGDAGQFKLVAKSETITTLSADCGAAETSNRRIAGEFYDPSPDDCMWFQISSSNTAATTW